MRRSSLRGIRLRCLGALALLAALACAAWALERSAINAQSDAGEQIERSGRQRMLSQRVALLAERLPKVPPSGRGIVRADLRTAIDSMERSRRQLLRSASPGVRAMYVDPGTLDDRVRRLLGAARDFAAADPPLQTDANLREVGAAAVSTLLDDLDAVVRRNTAEAEAGNAAIARVQTAVLVATLLVLLGTALLVFRPILRRVLREIAHVRLLETVAIAANEAVSTTEPLRETLQAVCEVAGWPIGHAYLLDEATGELESSRVWSSTPDEAFRIASESLTFAPGVGLPGRVLATGRPAWMRDVQRDPAFVRRSAAWAAQLHGGAAFPLLVRDRVVGVLEFFSRRAEVIDSELVFVMEHVGAQLGRVVERHQAAAELTHQAGHDALTGLPNRALLLDRLAIAAHRSQRTGVPVGLLFVDVDRFKSVNDGLGHHAGDALLVAIARRLDGLVRRSDTVARLGGDEFVVLCDDLADEAAILTLASRVNEACSVSLELGQGSTDVTVSIGVAVGCGAGVEADELLRDADLAMYRAKERGGGRVEIFDAVLRAASDERSRMEAALRRALAAGTLDVAYQPIVEMDAGTLTGFEALVRWTDAELGSVSPAVFIPVAEASGLIHVLGATVLERACFEAAGWDTDVPLRINVNLSARQVADPGIVERVAEILARTGLDPAQLGLELTETALLEESGTTVATLERLKGLGVRLVLDDFGTGYSSLGHLRNHPIDELKIDRSFVMRIEEVSADSAIVGAIAGLASSLGIGTVAEGVETPGQLAALRAMGCAKAQGYLIDRPLPPEGARARVAAAFPPSGALRPVARSAAGTAVA